MVQETLQVKKEFFNPYHPYPRLEYLQFLKLDHKTLIDDLAKMGRDRDYKPVFNPKSKEVLEKMNAEKRASLENEGLTYSP